SGRGVSAHRLGRRVDAGEVDLEGGPHAQLAVHPDESATLLHDAVHRCQAEARTLAFLLGGEERLEQVRLRLGIHAGAGVAAGAPWGATSSSSRSAYPVTAVRILWTSCALPPASRPTASIFCAWRSCCSSRTRSVTSRPMPRIPMSRSSRSWAVAENSVRR